MKRCSTRKTDRLSHLPDPIRRHIVSFLPMRDATRTSILSRCWERTCSSLSNLDFDQIEFKYKKRQAAEFRDFVDKMIISHDGSDIRRFRLQATIDGSYISTHHIDTWISFAVDHNVEVIDLCMDIGPGTLPRRFFTCNTVTTAIFENITIKLPSIVKFPTLKSFNLSSITFGDEKTLDKLISSSTCPVLEELSLEAFYLLSNTILISNSSLKHVKIFDMGHDEIIVDVPISTLQVIDFYLYKPSNLRFKNFSTVVDATFQFVGDFTAVGSIDYEFKCAINIMKELHSVKRLNLQNGFIDNLTWGQDLQTRLPSPCCSVNHLHIGMFSKKSHIQVILLLLRTCSNVQTLQICVEDPEVAEWAFPLEINMEEYLLLKNSSPGEVLNCLQTVEVEKFQGSDCELELITYLHDNAKVLENINISYSKREQSYVGREITEDMFSMFTRVSPHVSVLP